MVAIVALVVIVVVIVMVDGGWRGVGGGSFSCGVVVE